jgi:hypothetical protein
MIIGLATITKYLKQDLPMEAAELIRKLIDVLTQINEPAQAAAPQGAKLTAVLAPQPTGDFPEDEHTNDETGGIMVPPLQQKMELLKKISGVDSIYDQGESSEESQEDELSIIKRNAGIPMLTMVASEDNDALEN